MPSLARDPGHEHRHDGLDPVTASASALAHGRIGLVAWAIFERGDGLVLSFEKQGHYFTVEVDSASEWTAFHNFRLEAVFACKCRACEQDPVHGRSA